MDMPKIPLFDWLIENLPKAKYDLANSSISGVPFSELLSLTGSKIPNDFNLGKNDPNGADELRNALAKIYNCKKENIVTTTGGSEANFLVFLAMLKPGDEVIVEQPTYSPLWLVPQMLGARIVTWERAYENGFSLDLEELKNKITSRTKLIVITNLHNPSGVLIDNDTINAAAEIAAEQHAILFIDEMFLDTAESKQATAAGMESVLVTSSVSKVYGIGGLRTGWIVAQEHLAAQCLGAKWQTTVASPYFSEVLAAIALSKARQKRIERCKSIARHNFPVVNDWMEENTHLIDWVPPAGGILCFPRYHTRSRIDSVKLCQKLVHERGVLLSPGKYFGSEGHVRLTYMNPESELRNALGAFSAVLEASSRSG